jgi:membrane-associated protease RseP (regulator of RpoE activity)
MPQAGAEAAPAAAARAYLGVGGSQVPDLLGEHLGLPKGEGVVVRTLQPGGPADQAGLKANDVITKIDGKAVGSHDELRDAVAAHAPGKEIAVDFIHRGEVKAARVTLGSAPADPAGGAAGAVAGPLDQLMLDGMQPDQARLFREAIERNLKPFEGLDGGGEINPEALFGAEIQKRLQQMLQGLELPGELQMPELMGGGIHLQSSGKFRMFNPDGSGVEVKSVDGGKEVRVFGPGGKVEWEGPYDTPQDREAAPPEVRKKIDGLNIDMDFKGNGLRLNMRRGLPPADE